MAQPLIKIDKNPYKNIGKLIGFKEDKTGELTLNAIIAMPDSVFVLGKNEIFNGGTLGKTWWMKIKYTSQKNVNPYLVFEYGNIDYLDIYYRNSQNKIVHYNSGTFAKKDSRAFISTEYIFQIKDAGGDIKEIFIRAKAVNTLIAPIKLVDGITLAKSLVNKYIWQLLYVGIAFSLFLFNLLMYLSSKDNKHAQYMIRIFFLFYLYVLAYLNGYAHFLNPTIGKFILIHAHAFAAIGFIATILFNNSFLSLKTHMPKCLKWFNFLIFLWVIILVISLWDTRNLTNRIAQILIFITSISIIYTSIRALQLKNIYKRDRYMVFYLVGWLPICLSTVYVVLTLINILPLRDYTFKAITLAGIIEAILISIAMLGDRISALRRGKEKAEQQSIELIKERNHYLEQKIEERTKELQLTNIELQQSVDLKDKLFSIIAHDMRSPLSTLKLVLQLADKNMLSNDNLSQLLANIRKNTEQVQSMMDNLLNWSISQMKMQVYHPIEMDISQFLNEHLALYEELAAEKKITIQLYCQEKINMMVDKNQFSLIFRNLIDNAIKFTPLEGLIIVGLKIEGSHYKFYVTNTGAPIKEDVKLRILSSNQSLGTSYGTAKEKGAGLGLQLCKDFLKNLNSELKIDQTTIGIQDATCFSFMVSVNQLEIPND